MIPPLCFITDADAPLPIVEQAAGAARGGAGWIQLRHKTLPDSDFASLAKDVMAAIGAFGASLIINDRVEVARSLNAAGLHVGQTDGDVRKIREAIGPDMVLGLSIEAEDQLAAVPPGIVTYLGVGPVRATASKPDHAQPIGFDGLARIVEAAREPCMAIGGLDADDMVEVRRAGCVSVAVVSAISRAEDPQAATRRIITEWSRA